MCENCALVLILKLYFHKKIPTMGQMKSGFFFSFPFEKYGCYLLGLGILSYLLTLRELINVFETGFWVVVYLFSMAVFMEEKS